jgi:REP element-mobilizing transposase RayT
MMGRKGWHHRGYLPHFDGYDVAQHIVFSLIDALPAKSQSNGDDVLDRGHGSAILRNTRCAEIVQDALLHFNETRYGLRAWCIMPNHVHALVVTQRAHGIGLIVKSWKTYTAARINTALGRRGPVWARDYFDRFIRDNRHFATTVRYIERNPVAAGLCEKPQDWAFSSAGWKANIAHNA